MDLLQIYSVFLLIGGGVAYLLRGSLHSLIGAFVSALFIHAAPYLAKTLEWDQSTYVGHMLTRWARPALVSLPPFICLMLGLFFMWRFFLSHQLWQLLMSLLSFYVATQCYLSKI